MDEQNTCIWRISPTVVKPYDGVCYIHPLKQHDIECLLNWVRERFPNLGGLGVFGSAVTNRCNVNSDIDLIVWGQDSDKFFTDGSTEYDVIRAADLSTNSKLIDEIVRDGLQIYGDGINA